MSDQNYKPSGELQGDTKPMPNRGTSMGFTHVGNDTYGFDVSVNAINRMGSAHEAGDPPEMCYPPGDVDRFNASGHASPDPGTEFSADSDPVMKDRADNPKGL